MHQYFGGKHFFGGLFHSSYQDREYILKTKTSWHNIYVYLQKSTKKLCTDSNGENAESQK